MNWSASTNAGVVIAQVTGSSVVSWSAEQVGQWLTSVQMRDYAAMFIYHNVTGNQLLQLDSSQMKVAFLTASL